MTSYALGDSHTWVMAKGGFEVLSVPNLTMYGFGSKSDLMAYELHRRVPKINPEDNLLVSVGEIDVRRQFYHQIEELRRDVDEVCLDLAVRARLTANSLWMMGFHKVAFCAIPPPASYSGTKEIPTRGAMSQRVLWTSTLNRILRPEFDPYEKYSVYGEFDPIYTDTTVHLNERFGAEAFTPIRLELEKP